MCLLPRFMERASAEHIARFKRDCEGHGHIVIWDPNDDADGFMIAGRSIEELNQEFRSHFAGYLV